MDLVVRNGTVVTPGFVGEGDVGVEDGRVVAIGPRLGGAAEELDARGRLVIPGVVDPHVHLMDLTVAETVAERQVDDIYHGTRAAAAGGVTTVCDFAYQRRGESLRSAIDLAVHEATGRSSVDFSLHSWVSDPSEATRMEVPSLVEEGFPSFKFWDGPRGVRCSASRIPPAHGRDRQERRVGSHPLRRQGPDGLLHRSIRRERSDRCASLPCIEAASRGGECDRRAMEMVRVTGTRATSSMCPARLRWMSLAWPALRGSQCSWRRDLSISTSPRSGIKSRNIGGEVRGSAHLFGLSGTSRLFGKGWLRTTSIPLQPITLDGHWPRSLPRRPSRNRVWGPGIGDDAGAPVLGGCAQRPDLRDAVGRTALCRTCEGAWGVPSQGVPGSWSRR